MGKKRQNELCQLKRRERRAEKNELKEKAAEATAMLAITQLQLRSTEGKLAKTDLELQEQTEKATSTEAELAKTQRHLQDLSQEATSAKAKLTETERHLQERSQEARWATSMGNYYRSVLEDKKQELASLKKDIKKESAPATGSASSSSKVYLGLH
ncbi:unnamed protein product [Cladocopium goreaui]|uniref:Uncharacterized protein n=1 Tax=Cladocopium goreaui TaxID=2562237 RepID=A0A9P1GAQ2_9DINO|nr:unnamed protein product [Cladocopium goreaui]